VPKGVRVRRSCRSSVPKGVRVRRSRRSSVPKGSLLAPREPSKNHVCLFVGLAGRKRRSQSYLPP
jgi:hypothetical protein